MKKVLIYISSFLLINNFAFALNGQYYYYQNIKIDQDFFFEIYGINLETGEKKVVIPAKYKIGHPFILSDHSKILFKSQFDICVYNSTSISIDT